MLVLLGHICVQPRSKIINKEFSTPKIQQIQKSSTPKHKDKPVITKYKKIDFIIKENNLVLKISCFI